MEQPGGHSMARSTLYNLAGQILPLGVAILAVPRLIAYLGDDGFGLLTLAWIFVGYFSLFDLGLSRALTQLVSRKLGEHDTDGVASIGWTAILLSVAVALLGTAVMLLLAQRIAFDVLTMPDRFREDIVGSLVAIALAIPVIVTAANLRGMLEAVHRFDVINIIRIPVGVLTFAGPLLVIPFGGSLFDMVVVLVVSRLLGWIGYLVATLRLLPGLREGIQFDPAQVRTLLTFGGWMTLSNVVSPLMVYLDRFVIGVVLTASAVAYYATPWEVVTKLLLIPAAFSAVIFPAVGFWVGRDPDRAVDLYQSGLKLALIVLLPFVLLLIALARPGLEFWIGAGFAERSYLPMQILALGVFCFGIGSIPFAAIQGLGRPDITAKLHVAELPFYLALFWPLMSAYGIVGASIAWTLRGLLDLVFLHVCVRGMIRVRRADEMRVLVAFIASCLAAALVMLPENTSIRVGLALLMLMSFALLAWNHLVSGEEKKYLYKTFAARCT